MALKISGVTLGNITGGPSSLALQDLSDVSIVSPLTGEYLRYNGTIEEWQNVTIDPEVFNFLDNNLLGSNGVTITPISGPDTVTVGLGDITPLSVAATGTVTGSNISGSNTGDQTITLTGDVTGSGTGTFAATLATVNSSPQTDQFRKITVNGKGLVTASSSVNASDITTALSYTPVNRAGDTMAGYLVLNADPINAMGAATKQYVDNMAVGIIAKPAVLAATTANLAATYYNGTGNDGIGATLTATVDGVWPGVDGVTTGWGLTSGVLVKNQSTPAYNGRYYISDLGSVSSPWVLTRCIYCDTADEIPGSYVFVQDGTQKGTGWVAEVDDPTTFVVGTDDIDWFQFTGSGGSVTSVGVSGDNGISVSGSPITTSGTITLGLGNITPTSVAASGSVSGSNLSGTNTGDQTITLTGDVTGSGTGSFATTLSSTGVTPDTYRSVTVDAKGRITAGTNPTTLAGYGITDAVSKAGDTMTGALGVIAGSVGSPSMFVTGSVTTGIFSPGSDSISITTNGTERLRATSGSDLQFLGITTDTASNLGSISGSQNVSLAVGNYISFTINGSTTITFTNPPANGRVGSFLLEVTNGGSAAITWTGVTWISGTSPTLRASGINLIGIITRDGGTTYLGTLVA